MARLHEQRVSAIAPAVLGPLIGEGRLAHLESAAVATSALLDGRVIWNVNSTASGGGVAELLRALIGYSRGAGVDARWMVIEGDPQFFDITKRIHNRLHGTEGDEGSLGAEERSRYEEITSSNAWSLRDRARSGDVVLLHDPQTLGMAPWLKDAGLRVVWRCHIGSDTDNRWTEEGWWFLRPYLDVCDALIFSRRSYARSWMPDEKIWTIPPSIDPFSAKNAEISDADLPVFLSRLGLTQDRFDRPAVLTRNDGTRIEVTHAAAVVSERNRLGLEKLVVQVSRWDRLKDMHGVMVGFASGVVGRADAHLLLVGPSVDGVSDDPEGAEVLSQCIASWGSLPESVRRHISLLMLPIHDVDENAAMVNALQRSATVIVQKSLAEGFGLTVAEAMWKSRAVVASHVGGISDQVAPGTGILLEDPTDLEAFSEILVWLLDQPEEIRRFGSNARRHVLEQFVADRHLLNCARMLEQLLA